jgi:hypothetical protein
MATKAIPGKSSDMTETDSASPAKVALDSVSCKDTDADPRPCRLGEQQRLFGGESRRDQSDTFGLRDVGGPPASASGRVR